MRKDDLSSSNRKRRNYMKIPRNIKTVLTVQTPPTKPHSPLVWGTRFWCVTGMLNHQIEFSKAIQEIYKPISGRASDPNSAQPEGNAEGIQACEEYESAVKDLQETLRPELEMLETRVIQPANDLLAVVKTTQKVLTKRNHKLLDYDRTSPLFARGHYLICRPSRDPQKATRQKGEDVKGRKSVICCGECTWSRYPRLRLFQRYVEGGVT